MNSRGEIPYGLPHSMHRVPSRCMFTLSVMEHKQLYGDKPGAAEGEIGRVQDFHIDNQNVGGVIWPRVWARGCTLFLKNTHASEVLNEPGHPTNAELRQACPGL